MSNYVKYWRRKNIEKFKIIIYGGDIAFAIAWFKGKEETVLHNLRTFFGKTTINNEDADNFNFDRIYLEYYKNRNEEEIINDEKPYGVTIIKKTQTGKLLVIEEKEVTNIINKEKEADNILKLLVAYKVTPIGLDDVLQDLVSY